MGRRSRYARYSLPSTTTALGAPAHEPGFGSGGPATTVASCSRGSARARDGSDFGTAAPPVQLIDRRADPLWHDRLLGLLPFFAPQNGADLCVVPPRAG